jgi:hypothetical protein
MKKALSVLFLLSFLISSSQITFEKGYFINNGNSRTDCFIENMDWKKNPTSFSYKLQLADKETRQENIKNVKEFAIDQQNLYRKFQVQIEKSQTTTISQSYEKNPKWTIETVFLKAIVSGNANLYIYQDGNLTKFFYETATVPIEQLVMIEYLDNYRLAQNNLFRQQLFNNVKCEKMTTNTFENIRYSLNSLSSHFITYNECTSEKKEPIVNYQLFDTKRKKTNFRLMAGFYIASLQVNDPFEVYDASTKTSESLVKIGFDSEFFLPFNKNSWSIFLNPMYSNFRSTNNYDGIIINPGFAEDGNIINYDIEARYTQIEVPFGLRFYQYISPSSKVFFNAAYVLGFTLSDSQVKITNNNNLVNADSPLLLFQNRNGLAFGVGFCYQRISAEFRYNTTRDPTDSSLWEAKYSSLGLNFGFVIF